MSASKGEGMYYGWKIVFALMVMLTFTSGLSFYNHALYLNALAARPNFDVGSTSIAVSIFFLSGGLIGLKVARWVEDHDPRYCISAGAVVSCIALTGMAYVQELWQLFLVYSLFGIGFAAAGLVPSTTLVTRWFRKRRAVALSIASTGLSLGGVILTPLCALMIETLGFTTAAPLIGIIYLLGVIPVACIWLRPSPAALGLEVDGESPSAKPGQEKTPGAETQDWHESGISFRQARQGRLFWGMSVGYVFLMLAQVGGIAHQYGLARETLTEAQTAMAVAIIPIASIIGRLIGGWVVDQMPIRRFAIGMMLLQACSLTLLAGGFNVVSLCLGLFGFGASVGNLLMLQPLLIAEAFGVRDYARIFSVSNLMTSFGTAVGPALLGVAYAVSGSQYSLSYLVAAAAGAFGLMLFVSGGPLRAAERQRAD